MKKKFLILLIVGVFILGIAKKGILVVSFGTSNKDTRKVTIEAIESRIQKEFPEYEVRQAFTSKMIIRIIKKREGKVIDTTEEALAKMQKEGFNEVLVQPLHFLNGLEYNEMLDMVNEYKDKFKKIEVGTPLLTSTDDYFKVAEALKSQLPILTRNDAVVLMGHGTSHYTNATYPAFERTLEDTDVRGVYVGTVEGYPTLKDVIKKLKRDRIKKVILMPFMVVAGVHAHDDMAGETKDSWKNILEKEGFKVEIYMHGLGENKGIQDIYIQHLKNIM
ncbi:sirohydrochlorin cobaltochelatase [Tepiditoga spiralis]|uniref:Sirohydrochlorin cobaltochelatase n=1 Tax=Tepiditoga spiralis TaxID=2108365 RepID=A0A7G1G5D5_9BACT|nr:sirohydrochlorin cobaltochelatase [Tepiditoga spiralis]BBE31611.1 sirohydrochlorin cobaltochelatase [Tepiditoga spiralis]